MNSLIQDLNIQIHRGNHGSTKASAIDDDDQHEPSYHETVATMIEEIEDEINKGNFCDINKKVLIKKLNKYSRKLAAKINKNKVALSSVHTNFGTVNTNKKGCSNEVSISKINDESPQCSQDRDHSEIKVPTLLNILKVSKNGITTPKQDYKLKAGQ